MNKSALYNRIKEQKDIIWKCKKALRKWDIAHDKEKTFEILDMIDDAEKEIAQCQKDIFFA